MSPGPGVSECAHAHEPHAGEPPEAHDHGFVGTVAAIGLEERARKRRRLLFAALFAVAGSTLLAELGLRASGARAEERAARLAATDARLGAACAEGLLESVADERRYRLRRGFELATEAGPLRISPQGTRGAAVPPKAEGERRLLVLGDELALGFWCREEELLATVLAARAGAPWRGLALGTPGYHLGQMAAAFELEGLALEPDLVVLLSSSGDLERVGFELDRGSGLLRRDYLPLPKALRAPLWHASHLYGWIVAAHARAVEDGPAPHFEPRVPWSPVRADNQAASGAALRRLAGACRARALPLLVVHLPHADPHRADGPGAELARQFLALAATANLPVLLWDAGVEHRDGDGLTARAQQALAELALERLRAEGWL